MESPVQFTAGEEIEFDYTDERERNIWGRHFEFGDAIVVHLKCDVTLGDLHRNMGKGGPWGWGAFTTKWIESIAEQIEWLYDDSILYRTPRKNIPSDNHVLVQKPHSTQRGSLGAQA